MRSLLTLALLLIACTPTARGQEATGADADVDLLRRADIARMIWLNPGGPTIDEFVDYACSTCRSFHAERADSLKDFVSAERMTLTIRMYPIPRLLRGYHGAEAAFCAGALKGRSAFISMHNVLFNDQLSWSKLADPTPVLESYAARLGVPVQEFRDCMARDAMAPLIISDIRLAESAGVRGTPTFVFNKAEEFNGDELFYGNQPMTQFKESLARIRSR